MAISSSSTTTTKSGSTLDVAGIVSGLMQVENFPIDKLDAKISKSSVKITSLGLIKSQLSTFKSTLVDLQTPANFSKQSAKFSDTSVGSANITSSATAASYQMEVISLAQPAVWNISGFSSKQDALDWYEDTTQISNPNRLDITPTVFKSAENVYVLSLEAKSHNDLFGTTGNNIPVLNGSLSGLGYGNSITFSRGQESVNAVFKLNGVEFTRSSNTVSDALTGITLNLTGTTPADKPATLSVTNDAVSPRPKLDALVKAYNDLYALYKSQTASSLNAASRGILNSDFAVSNMMRQLISGLMLPMKNLTGGTFTDTGSNDLSAMGIKLLDGGNLAVDDTLLNTASSNLQNRLAAGIRIGYSVDSKTDLSVQISDMLLAGGVIQDRINNETSTQSDLNKRKSTLQEKLIGIQARYTAQYASLDALLFKLQGTSDSLKSAIDGLTNSQKNG